MSPRTKILVYIAFAGLLLFQASEMIQQKFVEEPKKVLEGRKKTLKKDIAKYDKIIKAGATAQKQIPDWERQALPEEVDRASALYKNWLLQLVERAGLKNTNVEANSSVSTKKGVYKSLSFSLRGKGNLQQMTALLYEFYHTNLLHRINS
ncbi:MAG: hypothetical protein R3C11_23660 [Planctomycetaceae bacterium]